MNERLYKKVGKLDWQPEHVAEIGVYFPETSNVLGFIEDGCITDLVEADPICIEKINKRFGNYDNIRIHPFAIFDRPGTIELYRVGASTFVRGIDSSPALANDNYIPDDEHVFTAQARLFSDIDDGTIDLISIDIEGCEWFVLKEMKSRPDVISIEIGAKGKRYKNSFLNEIQNWLSKNNYRLWYRDGSDAVYTSSNLRPSFWSRWFKSQKN